MRRALILFLSVIVPATVLAEGAEPLEGVRVYETATVQARPVASATSTVTVMEREEILALGVNSVAEVVRFIPGLDVTTSGPRGGFATAQVRGGEPNFTMVLVDGVPFNDITDQFGGAVNLNSLAVGDIERIEVVRGPVSSFYGSSGLAGAVNIITRRGSGAPELTFDVAAGDNDLVQGRVGFGGGVDERNHFVTAWYEEQEDQVEDDRFEQVGIQGNALLPVGNHGELKITGRLTSWETDDYSEASGGPVFGTGELRESENDEYSGGIEWWLGQDELRQKIHLNVYRHELDRSTPSIPPVQPSFTEDTTFTSWRAGWAMPQIQAGRHLIGVGVEAIFEDGESDSVVDVGFPLDANFSIDRTMGGAFVEVRSEYGPVLVELGLRIDEPEDFDTEVSPRVGVLWPLANDKTRLHASVGRAFKLPSFFALANPLVGNPDLDPEVSIGADLGVDHTFGPKVDTSVTLFFNRFDDLVDFDFGTLSNVNESIDSYGVEASATWRPIETIDVRANVTRQELDREDSDDPVRNRPEWYGGLRFQWWLTERARWALDGQWVSERDDEQIPTGPGKAAGYQLYGTTFAYSIGEAWEIRGRVDNLTDKEYEALIGFPGPERSFFVGLRRGG